MLGSVYCADCFWDLTLLDLARAHATPKAIIMMVVRTGKMKINFSKRTLRPFLVEQVPPEVNGCSLLANIELVCLHGSMVLMCSL